MTTKRLPAIPLRDVVVFPGVTLPLYIGREKSIVSIEEAKKTGDEILLVGQKNAGDSDPSYDDVFSIGTLAKIKQLTTLSDGNVKIIVEGLSRSQILEFKNEKFFEARIETLIDERSAIEEETRWTDALKGHIKSYFQLLGRNSSEIFKALDAIENPHEIVSLLASQIPFKFKDRQSLLEASRAVERLELLSTLILSEIEIIKLDRKIKGHVKERLEKSQKDYFLNEQLNAIQKELGQDNDSKEEIKAFEERLAKKDMPDAARDRVIKEIKKLKSANAHPAESAVIRNYIELILDLPWNEFSQDEKGIEKAEKVLNNDHYGLKDVKERILEYLAVRSQVDNLKAPILCLIGPPGVGKTSLARSVAESLNRKFERISLGGIRDEAELRGHRRTYVAALPGRIISALKNAKTSNPVILLDEIDKLGNDFRGDPASALLEILDPEQNKHFTDHFLDLEYDLSKVLFVATANVADTLSPPLKDRLEMIQISGYTEKEKIEIAKSHLIPKEAVAHGLANQSLALTDENIRFMIQNYTREAGVRGLSKQIAKLSRKIVLKKLKSSEEVTLDTAQIEQFLGVPKFRNSEALQKPEVGVVTGLAWTPTGGEVLTVESEVIPGRGKLQITGQLGDVMQESARAALTYIRSCVHRFGFESDYFAKRDIHIHVPEGAIPKDGPSAGITMATSLLSAILEFPISKEIGMTGEITLRGRVLPIGGLKEKLLAAKRAKIKKVYYPLENERDKNQIDAEILEGLELKPIAHADDLLKDIFGCIRRASTQTGEPVSDFYVDQKPVNPPLGSGSLFLLES